jgi:enoyl-CoA hydratase
VATRVVPSQLDEILLLTLESDAGYPRLSREVLAELNLQVEFLAGARELRGAIVAGSDRAFAVGADISELAELNASDAFGFSRYGQSVMAAIFRSSKPIAAAIRGYCLGGGLDLALACHTRIAAPDAEFAHPGGALGLMTGWGGTQRLPRLIARNRALEMLITGRRLDAQEGLACGLIQQIVPAPEITSACIQWLRPRAD